MQTHKQKLFFLLIIKLLTIAPERYVLCIHMYSLQPWFLGQKDT